MFKPPAKRRYAGIKLGLLKDGKWLYTVPSRHFYYRKTKTGKRVKVFLDIVEGDLVEYAKYNRDKLKEWVKEHMPDNAGYKGVYNDIVTELGIVHWTKADYKKFVSILSELSPQGYQKHLMVKDISKARRAERQRKLIEARARRLVPERRGRSPALPSPNRSRSRTDSDFNAGMNLPPVSRSASRSITPRPAPRPVTKTRKRKADQLGTALNTPKGKRPRRTNNSLSAGMTRRRQ